MILKIFWLEKKSKLYYYLFANKLDFFGLLCANNINTCDYKKL